MGMWNTTRAAPRGASDSADSLCEAPLLRTSLPTILGNAWAAWEASVPAPFEREVDKLAKHWDRCSSVGGRLWEVHSAEAGVEGGLTLCAHHVCTQQDVEDKAWRTHLRRLKGQTPASPATALELAHWRQLHLDFVLAGFEKCGTSSLSHNLASHPHVDFVPMVDADPNVNTDNQNAQDGNFFWFVGNRLLPPAELVHAFNRGDCCKGGAMPQLQPAAGKADRTSSSSVRERFRHGSTGIEEDLGSRDHGDQRPRVRGERNPVYAFQRFIMKAISLVPGARVLLIVCDPIGWLHSAYRDTTNWYAGQPGDPPRPQLSEFASAEMVPATRSTSLSQSGWYNLSRRRALFSLFIEGLMQLFGSEAQARIHLLHRDSVDDRVSDAEKVAEAYDRISSFLGVEPFQKDVVFERRNIGKAAKGRASGDAFTPRASLCVQEEAASLATLKRYYRREYRLMADLLVRLGGSVPQRLANNLTYCDK